MAKYLDETGLAHFWDNAKDYFANNYMPFEYGDYPFTGANGNNATVHYAKIPNDYKPSLVLANDTVDTVQYEIDAAYAKQSAVLINAGIFNASTSKTEGVVIADGAVRNNAATSLDDRSILYMASDGTLASVESGTLTGNDVLNTYHPIWAVTGFYPFVENGTFTGGDHDTTDYQPRSCIAQDSAGNYLVFACAGRSKSNDKVTGMSIADMYAFINAIGFAAQFAYNLDGGVSSSLTVMGVRANALTENDHRRVANFLSFKKSDVDNREQFDLARVAAQAILRNGMEDTTLFGTKFTQFVEEGQSTLRSIECIDKSTSDYVYTTRFYENFDTSSGLYRIQTRRPSDASVVQAFALNSNYQIGALFGNNIATQKVINYLSWSARNAGTYTLESTDMSEIQKFIAIFQQDGINFMVDFFPYNFDRPSTSMNLRNTVATPSGDILNFLLACSGGSLTYSYGTPTSGKAVSLQRLIGVDHR